MADSPFSLSKILGWLKKFLSSMPSPLEGFDINDVKVKEENGEFAVLYQFKPSGTSYTTDGENETASEQQISNIKNEILELDVLIKAMNVQEVFSPILSGINKLTPDNIEGENKILDILLGTDREKGSLAVQSGEGLLGEDLTKGATKWGSKVDAINFVGKTWTWGYILEYLSYALECSSPGKDYGSIDNVNYKDCGKLIGEYLVKMGVIDNASEIKLSEGDLISPILNRIQAWLREYYEDACKKYIGNNTEEQADTEENTENTSEDNNENTGTSEESPKAGAEATTQIKQQPTQEGAPVTNSKHIDVTLHKIAGSTAFNMTAIKANYAPTEVLEDMDEIIGQPEFISSLPEEPTTYSIDVDDEGFDIEPCEECEECNPCESLCEVFKAGIRAYRNLYILHWMSHGNDMMKLHLMTEEMYEELQGEIDTIGELLVEKQGTVPQLDFPCDYIPVQQYDFQTGLDHIKSLIQMYIDCIDYAYCNQDSDVQSTLDEWLRYWNKQLNYFVKGQEV